MRVRSRGLLWFWLEMECVEGLESSEILVFGAFWSNVLDPRWLWISMSEVEAEEAIVIAIATVLCF